MKQEKLVLEEQLEAVTSRAERDRETARREERLLLSAIYDVGLRMMDNKLQEQVNFMTSSDPSTPQAQSSGVLSGQRAKIEKMGLGLGSLASPGGSAATGSALSIFSPTSTSKVESTAGAAF